VSRPSPPNVKIDCYPHILARPAFDALERLPAPTLDVPPLYDVDARLRVMNAFEDYAQILVPFPVQPLVPALGGSERAAAVIRASNDFLAEQIAAHPQRFLGFAAALPLFDPDAAMNELLRCLDELGAVGAQVETNIDGVPISNDRFEPLLAELAARQRPVWLHPVRGPQTPDFASEHRGRFGLWQVLGWPFETSIVMTRLVLSGHFDRYPTSRIIVHHGGAMIPHYCGRLGEVLEHLGGIGFDPELRESVESLRRPIDDYFRMFYADTVLFGAGHAVRCVLDYFGIDHVLFGTDMPFDPDKGPRFIRSTIDNVEALNLHDEDRQLLYEGNARRIILS
jgi:predicted TIM-barrel fold metal-dependent hydrolase